MNILDLNKHIIANLLKKVAMSNETRKYFFIISHPHWKDGNKTRNICIYTYTNNIGTKRSAKSFNHHDLHVLFEDRIDW